MHGSSVFPFWAVLTAVSLANVAYIVRTAASNARADLRLPIYLSMLYTVVCAVRATWPRLDTEQQCLFDQPISTPLVGRTLATLAELAFVLFLIHFARHVLIAAKAHRRSHDRVLLAVFAMILVAQVFCWIGVTSKRPLWNAAEESLWALSALLLLVLLGLAQCRLRGDAFLSRWLGAYTLVAVLYVAFMAAYDVPMYVRKAQTDRPSRSVLSVQSYVDLNRCETVDWSYDSWKAELPWLSGYFVGGVWLTFSMIHVMQRRRLG